MPQPWADSTRRARLPVNWVQIRLAVLQRDHGRCYLCGAAANRVDHIDPGDDHRPTNLAAICLPCDKKKSAREGGRVTAGRAPRQQERHPGLR